MRLRRLTAGLLVSILCLAAGVELFGAVRAAEPAGVTERWLELRIAGVAAGYGHEVVASGEAGARQTTVDSALVLARLDARVEISEHEVTIEDRDGRLTSVYSEIRASREATVLDLSVSGEELAITTTADKTARKSRLFINSLDLTFLHTRSIFLNFELPPRLGIGSRLIFDWENCGFVYLAYFLP